MVLPSHEAHTSGVKPGGGNPKPSGGVNFMLKLLHEDSLHDNFKDEVDAFLRATVTGEKRADPLDWLCTNEKRYCNIAPLAQDLLSIHAS